MKVIFAKEPFDHSKNSIFLAGPTPRSTHPFPSWRPDALRILEELNFSETVFVPEGSNWKCEGDYIEQVEWEDRAMNDAGCIVFWFARQFPEMPAFTSNDEWGYWKSSGKVVFGAPEWAVKVNYQKWYAQKFGVPMAETLKETLQNAMILLTKRSGEGRLSRTRSKMSSIGRPFLSRIRTRRSRHGSR